MWARFILARQVLPGFIGLAVAVPFLLAGIRAWAAGSPLWALFDFYWAVALFPVIVFLVRGVLHVQVDRDEVTPGSRR